MGDVCNHLLSDPETLEFIAERGPGAKPASSCPTSRPLTSPGARDCVMEPPSEPRRRLDSKIVMTRLAEQAGVPSVPHAIGRAGTYDELLTLAQGAGLGDDLVVQDPYGNAGSGTYFVRSRSDWDQCADDLTGQREVKVMKRIRNVEVCLEGAVTRYGTVVGPAMTSLVGYPN